MADNVRAHLIHAFRKVLRPLVKILIRAGVQFDEFVEVIKGVYVESAVRDGVGREGPVTRGRVAIVTGVPRRDVDRYIDDESLLAPPPPTNATTLTEVLHVWNTDPQYLGPYGIPLEIDYSDTPGRCFSELVRRVNPKAVAEEILDELLKSGAVVRSGDRHVKVMSRTYVTAEEISPVALEYLGNTLANLATTIQYNLTELEGPKRIERSVFADGGLSLEQMPAFDQFARAKVQQLIVDIDDWLSEHTSPGEVPHDAVPTGLNIFHYVKTAAQDRPLRLLMSGEKTPN